MGLAGTGAVAIWHDIAEEGRQNFYDWHGREHMPERVAIPGFRRGRRYIAFDADLEYFNLYEADSLAVVTGPDYQERLNNPTPWTVDSVQHYRRVARSLCQVVASVGPGQGGLVATLRYDLADDDWARHAEAMSRERLPSLAEEAPIAGAHLLLADAEASALDTAERKLRAEKNRVPRRILVIEGWGDEDDFVAHCRQALSADALSTLGVQEPPQLGFYRLQATAI